MKLYWLRSPIVLSILLIAPTPSFAAADPPAPTATVHFTIDATQNVKPISPFIYGVNQKLQGPYSNLTLTRAGGNRWTAYNWVNNASNAGSDYQFQNDNLLGGGDTPGGALVPALDNALAHNAGIVVTIPINGYVSADKKGGGDVRKSGANMLSTRFHVEQPRKGSAFTLTPDPQTPIVYQDEFVNWLKTRYPTDFTDARHPIFFDLDNEPDLWSSTHAEVHPKPATYAEMAEKTIAYALAIKDVAPAAMIFGPVNYGWQGFVRLQNAPDAGNRDFQEFYLQQMAAAQKKYGKRLLDVLDVHWYPEARGGGVRIVGQETAPAVVAARVQAPRSLWDPTFVEKSWIADSLGHQSIKLLPRLEDKIDRNYPGTRLAISEYNYGGGKDISGAIAEADVLGILGRQSVFAACVWPMARDESFIAGALNMYRNFDGKGSTFGDTSILAAADAIADSSIYASLDSTHPGRMVLCAINKTDRPIAAQFHLEHARPYARAEIFQLTSAGPTPKSAGDLAIPTPPDFSYTMPPYSISILQLATAKPAMP